MKKTLNIFVLMLFVMMFVACQKNEEKQQDLSKVNSAEIIAIEDSANRALIDKNTTFEAKLEIFTKLKNLDDHKSETGKWLQSSINNDIGLLLQKKDLKKAYDEAESLFKVFPDRQDGLTLVASSKGLAQKAIDDKNYQDAYDYASRALQILWDEEVMSMKLKAEIALMENAIKNNKLDIAKNYYDDVLSVTSIKGNEKLAEKYRASAEKYSDKFPKDTKPENEPTATIVK